MKKTISIFLTIALVFTMGAVTVFAADTKYITTSAELAQAILNQADGETWILAPNTTFDLDPTQVATYSAISINSETNFIFPIKANNLTIKGGMGTVITSSMIIDASVGGLWHWQNFITIGGNNVTLDGLTLIPNINHYYDDSNGVNKVIEVLGKDSKIKNLTVEPNSSGGTKDFSGSIYYSNGIGSSDTLENVYLSKGRVSLSGKTGGTLTMTNVTIDFVGALLAAPDFIGFQPNTGVIYTINGSTLLMNQNRINLLTAKPNYPAVLTLKAADQGSEVTAKADVTYTVIIPASVNFGIIKKTDTPKTETFAVKVEGALLEDGYSIRVENTTASGNMVMKDKNGTGNKILAFTLSQSVFPFTSDGTVTANVSCTPANLQAAGSYKGFMTFSVSYALVPAV